MRSWQRLLSELSTGLLALFLALIVWVVAVYEEAPPRTDLLPSPVPIQILDLSQSLIISNAIPTEVKVEVRALADTWENLKPGDFQATIDLLGLGPGQHEVPVVVTTLLQDVSIEDRQPASITVNLEETLEREIRVRIKVLDEERVPLGYVTRLPEASPEEVAIGGPRSTVERVAEAVIEVSVSDARDTVTKQDTPLLLDETGRRVRGLTMTPELVTVSVVVERQGGYRDVAVRAAIEGTPAAGYWVSSITVEPVLVTLWGEQSIIEQLPGYVDTQPIDVSEAKSDVMRRVGLSLPEGVLSLGDGSGPQGILVSISIQPQLGGRTIYALPVEIRGLRLGLIAQTSPTSVDIILSGPLPALQDLQPEDIQVILNLVGLSEGTHKVTPVAVLPEGLGLEVKSIVPDIVEVTIE
jgi:YbbR domain-containing protein